MRNQKKSRHLANYHEQALFTDPDMDGIGNIAAQTIIPPIIDALRSIASETEALKLQYIGISYKPVSSGRGVFGTVEVLADGCRPCCCCRSSCHCST